MEPKIKPSFWSDPELAAIRGEERAWVNLTLLWIYTNPATNLIGLLKPSPQVFEFQTGLEPRWLNMTLEKFSHWFCRDGEKVLILNYVEHQIGRGKNLLRNNITKGLDKPFEGLTENQKLAFLTNYPELKGLARAWRRALEGLDDPYAQYVPDSPSEMLNQRSKSPSKPFEGVREGEGEGEGEGESSKRGSGGGEIPTLEEVLTFGQMQNIPEDVCRLYWLKRDEAGWQCRPGVHVGNWRSGLRIEWTYAQSRLASYGSGRLNSRPGPQQEEREEIQARLEYERDPAVIRELRDKLAALGGAKLKT